MAQVSIQQAIAEGMRLQQSGHLREAESIYRQILANASDQPDALHLLGLVAFQAGQPDPALKLISQALQIDPAVPHYHANLGLVLASLGRFDDAIAAYRRALQLQPDHQQAHANLANALYAMGHDDQAIAAYRQALALQPGSAPLLSNLSATLMRQGNNDEAIAAARRAIALEPNFADAHHNLAAALARTGQFDAAIEIYRAAIALRPDSALAHLNLALLLLRNGDYQHGWEEYAWRLKIPGLVQFPKIMDRPAWNGEELRGGTILLHAEQGFGDTLQFVRYVPLVARRGGRIILGCQPELQRLFRGIEGVSRCITPADPLPPFDCQCALSTLPMVFQTRVESIPAEMPYLRAETNSAFRIPHSAFLNVGLVWAGRTGPRDDRARSLSLDQLAPLAKIEGIPFHSLQKGDASQQTKTPPPGMSLTDWNSRLHDFVDTAALIANLDLVITIDSAVAHLAGALGKPAFVLLPFVADWRWMKDVEVSPWYPTLRLFRQSVPGDWAGVVAHVGEALRALINVPPEKRIL